MEEGELFCCWVIHGMLPGSPVVVKWMAVDVSSSCMLADIYWQLEAKGKLPSDLVSMGMDELIYHM